MAMAADDEEKSVSDSTDCSICLSTWDNPRSLLGCDHTFCLKCLEKYIETCDEQDHNVACPNCRNEFIVPQGGLKALSTHFMVQQLLDSRNARPPESSSSTSLSQQSPQAICEVCTTELATSFCVQCTQDLCQSCSKNHSRTRATKDHKVIALAEKGD